MLKRFHDKINSVQRNKGTRFADFCFKPHNHFALSTESDRGNLNSNILVGFNETLIMFSVFWVKSFCRLSSYKISSLVSCQWPLQMQIRQREQFEWFSNRARRVNGKNSMNKAERGGWMNQPKELPSGESIFDESLAQTS